MFQRLARLFGGSGARSSTQPDQSHNQRDVERQLASAQLVLLERKHGVSPLRRDWYGVLSKAPRGSCGWLAAWEIKQSLPFAEQFAQMYVYAMPSSTVGARFHKAETGEVYLICFVTPDVRRQFEEASRLTSSFVHFEATKPMATGGYSRVERDPTVFPIAVNIKSVASFGHSTPFGEEAVISVTAAGSEL